MQSQIPVYISPRKNAVITKGRCKKVLEDEEISDSGWGTIRVCVIRGR